MVKNLQKIYFKYFHDKNISNIVQDIFLIEDDNIPKNHPLFNDLLDLYYNNDFLHYPLIKTESKYDDAVSCNLDFNKMSDIYYQLPNHLLVMHKLCLLITFKKDFLKMINEKQKITEKLQINDDDLFFIGEALIEAINQIYNVTKLELSFKHILNILLNKKIKITIPKRRKNSICKQSSYDDELVCKTEEDKYYGYTNIIKENFYKALINKEILILKENERHNNNYTTT